MFPPQPTPGRYPGRSPSQAPDRGIVDKACHGNRNGESGGGQLGDELIGIS